MVVEPTNAVMNAKTTGGEMEVEIVPDVSLRARVFNLHTAISLVAAVAIIWFLMTRLDLDLTVTWGNIKRADPLLYVLAFLTYYLGFPLRAARWKLLLQNVGSADERASLPGVLGLARIIYLGWFTNCIVIAKLGDLYRAYLLKHRIGMSFSRTFGTILAERIIDVVILFSLLSISALTVLRRLQGPGNGSALFVLVLGLAFVVAIAAGLLVMRHQGHLIRRLVPARFRPAYDRFEHGTLASFNQLPLVAVLTVVIWCCEAGALFLISQALGLPLSLPMVVFVALAGSLLTTVPGLPGGLIIVEGGMAGALSLVMPVESAASVAILYRTISYWSLVVLGLALYLLTMRGSQRAHRP